MIHTEYFRKKYQHLINFRLSMGSVISLKHGRKAEEMDFDVWLPTKQCNLQRPLVWTLEQKQQFILFILRGNAMPPFTVVIHEYENGSRVRQVIDGKQRLNTLFEFIDMKFGIPVDNNVAYFNDLADELKSDITNPTGFVWDTHYSYWDDPISDDTKIAIFEQINFTGTPHDLEHLNKLKSQ